MVDGGGYRAGNKDIRVNTQDVYRKNMVGNTRRHGNKTFTTFPPAFLDIMYSMKSMHVLHTLEIAVLLQTE